MNPETPSVIVWKKRSRAFYSKSGFTYQFAKA